MNKTQTKDQKSSGISPHAKLHEIGLTDSRWTGGFWADRFGNCRDSMVPVMGKLMQETERARFIGNFMVACGAEEGKRRGPKWNDGDFYKWLEGAAAVYAFTKDPALDAEMDRLIEMIARTQAEDGYIHTDVQARQLQGEDVPRFGNPMDFEMYNMGHLIAAACIHHEATGKDNLLKVAIKAADFLDREFADPRPEQARHGICPSHLMGLTDLYRVTGNRKYIDLAERLLNMRDLVTQGDDDNQDRVPLRRHEVAHGHAVRATYLYCGAADVYIEKGEQALLDPMLKVWQDLVSKKLYITGGCGALYDGASPDGVEEQLTITRVHQAFGRNYQLPQSTAHNETCAAIGSMLWNWRMLRITSESRFADLLELTLYNSVLAGVSLDGTAYFYTNTLRQLDPMPVDLRWPRHRTTYMSCWCCPPNVVRTVAESSQLGYMKSDRGIHTVLYGSSKLRTTLADGSTVALTQETNYPWDGKIAITVDESPAGEWSLFVRIPQWTEGAELRLNGAPQAAPASGSYVELRRRWKQGDRVELDLPMPARLMQAHPLVEEARNHVAVTRGPIVYCLEGVDLPGDVRLLDVYIRGDTPLEVRGNGAPGGVPSIEARGVVREAPDFTGALYRPLAGTGGREIDLKLIPYFAWDNRGASEMSVWLPLA